MLVQTQRFCFDPTVLPLTSLIHDVIPLLKMKLWNACAKQNRSPCDQHANMVQLLRFYAAQDGPPYHGNKHRPTKLERLA